MCSIQEELSFFTPKKSKETICCKCKVNSSFIMIGTSGSYCRDCFNDYFAHKFRATIGKNPIIRRNSKVALAFSGGKSSAASLYLVKKGLEAETRKKLRFDVGLIFIDESAILQNHDIQFQQNEVETLMKNSQLPYHIVRLEKVLTFSYSSQLSSSNNDEDLDQLKISLQQTFESLKTLTAKQELLNRLRSRLISIEAKNLGYSYAISGENNSRLAVTTLCSVTMGRDGNCLQQDCSFSDGHRARFAGGVHILRPMKDTSAREIATYVNLHKIPTVFIPNLSTFKDQHDSIQTLTENFIVGLAVNFPATEMTISKTSGKLRRNPEDSSSFCGLCHADLTDADDSRIDDKLDAIQRVECCSSGDICCCRHFITATDFYDNINKLCQVVPNNCKYLCYSCTSLLVENV